MGRSGAGVEVRPKSIRLSFVLVPGEAPVRRTLMIAGKVAAPTAANIKYAHRLAAEIRERIRYGTFSMAEYFPASGNPGEAVTLAARLDVWLGSQNVAHSTKAGYESAVRFWKARLGPRHVRALVRSDFLSAIADTGLKRKTLKNYASAGFQAMELCVADKLLDENPAAKLLPKGRVQGVQADPFTRDEVARIVAYAKRYPEPIYNLIEWWMHTGVRTSEMAGLKWSSVDLAANYFEVSEALVRGKPKNTTKTNTARRVKMLAPARAALQRQRAHTQMGQTGHVWLDPRYGTPWTEERAFRRSYWTPMLKALGIRYRRPYQMRHTCATMMLMAGRKPAWCAAQLGHSTKLFLDTYARWIPGADDDREVQAMDAWLANPGDESGDESGASRGTRGQK